jgi:membrane protein
VVTLAVGDHVVAFLVSRGGLKDSSGLLIAAFRWPVLLLISTFFVQQLYYLLPDVRPRWRPWSTGAFVAVLGSVGTTIALGKVASTFLRYNLAYGALGSLTVVMLWMYLGCLMLLVGAGLNALKARGLHRPDMTRESHADEP